MMIIALLKNDYYRAMGKKSYIIISIIMTVLSIAMAIYFTTEVKQKENIALITNSNKVIINSPYLKIDKLKVIPPLSDLVMDKYDAVVIDRGNGNFQIETLKGSKFKSEIEKFISNSFNSVPDANVESGVGVNILGYLMMFLLFQGIIFITFFTEDREVGTLRRIITTPVSRGGYLAAQSIFNFLLIYIPAIFILTVCREFFRIKIGFSLLQYSWILALIVILSTAFAVFLSVMVKKLDNSMALSTSIIVLTSILSGSFGAAGSSSSIMNVLPQKNLLMIAKGIEGGSNFTSYFPSVMYIIALSLLFLSIGVFKKWDI